MICPTCEKEGEKSKVYSQGGSSTLLGYSPFYDEEGRYHNHDPNRTTAYYECSRGHRWSAIIDNSCWCGWSTKKES